MQTINADTNIDAIVEKEAANIDSEWAAVSDDWRAQVMAEMGDSFPGSKVLANA